jgi:hypothetical protein
MFAGGAPRLSELGATSFRFDKFGIGMSRVFASWLSASAALEVESHPDEQGTVRATVFVVSEYTLHGSIRVAAACDSEGKVTGAELLEVSEEAYNWVKPLIDQNYMKQVLQDSPALPANTGSMTKYYAEQIAKVIHQVPSLCDLVKR